MADNTDAPEMGNFSIQDTIGAGTGSQELIDGLLGEEIDPNDITPITDEVSTTAETTTVAPTNKPAKQEKPKKDTSIQDFLAGGAEEEEEEEDKEKEEEGTLTTTYTTTVAPAASEEEEEEEEEEGGTPFESLSKELTELGVFTPQGDGEEAITTPELFLEKFQIEKQNGANEIVNNFIGQFGQDYQDAFNAIYVKGADPKEYFTTASKIQDFTNMDLTVEDNQKIVIRQALTDQGFEGEDINLEIERLTNYGDLADVAGRHHKVLVKKETKKLKDIEASSQADLEQKAAIRNVYINNVQKTLTDKLKEKGFDGIPLNPALANELHDFLLVDKYKTPSGETLTDFDRTILDLKKPENHATKVKIGLLLKMLEKDPTLSTIQKAGVTKKTDALFKDVARQVTKPGKKKSTKEAAAPKRWFK